MLSITELQPGVSIKFNAKLYIVTDSKHLKMGRGGGIQQVKMRCLTDGTVLQNNFKGNEKVEEANLNRQTCQYLYTDSNGSYFMDLNTFEQYCLSAQNTPKELEVVPEGTNVDIVLYHEKPVFAYLPIKVTVKVKEAAPGVKGDRSSAGTKTITLETGATIQVPLFIKTGDVIIVDTRTRGYVERAR